MIGLVSDPTTGLYVLYLVSQNQTTTGLTVNGEHSAYIEASSIPVEPYINKKYELPEALCGAILFSGALAFRIFRIR